MEKTIVSVASFLDAIHTFFFETDKPAKTIDYYFLTPQEIFDFINVEDTPENTQNFIEAVSLLIKRSIKSEYGIQSWTNIKRHEDIGIGRFLKMHPKCTSEHYQLAYFNDCNMHLQKFSVGEKYIYGDGSYTIDLTAPFSTKEWEYDMDRELERDAEFIVVEEPYFGYYNYNFSERPIYSVRFITIKSLKTGKIYRVYCNNYTRSIVSSESLNEIFKDYSYDYDDYEIYDD